MYKAKEVVKIKNHIIKEIATGRSLREILNTDPGMPDRAIIYEWLNSQNKKFDAEFLNNYTRAKEESAESDVEKIEEIVELVRNGSIKPDQGRVMGDLLKWTAGKKKPKKYGDRVDLTTNGKDITSQVTIFQLPDNQRDN